MAKCCKAPRTSYELPFQTHAESLNLWVLLTAEQGPNIARRIESVQASGPRHCHKQGQVTDSICKVTGFGRDMGSSSAEEMLKKVMDDGGEERHDPVKKTAATAQLSKLLCLSTRRPGAWEGIPCFTNHTATLFRTRRFPTSRGKGVVMPVKSSVGLASVQRVQSECRGQRAP